MPGNRITGTLQPALLAPQPPRHWHLVTCVAGIVGPALPASQTPHHCHSRLRVADTVYPALLPLQTLHHWRCWGSCTAGAEDPARLALRALAQQTCMADSLSVEGTPRLPACPGCVGLCYIHKVQAGACRTWLLHGPQSLSTPELQLSLTAQ